MAKGIDLKTPRQLQAVEDIDGFSSIVINREASQLLNKKIMTFHLTMMLAFITIIGAPFAWLAALFNILLSPKVASWRIRCSQHGVQLTDLYSRAELGTKHATSNEGTIGPKVWGLGESPEPLNFSFSEITEMGWNAHEIWFSMRNEETRSINMELITKEGIAELGQMIKDRWTSFDAGLTAEEADQQRNQLHELVGQMPPAQTS